MRKGIRGDKGRHGGMRGDGVFAHRAIGRWVLCEATDVRQCNRGRYGI